MRKTKLQKGITLIALIITIVVLLILAVVAISAVQESDIIVRAKEAVKEHEEGKERELITLAYSEYFMSKTTDPNATLKVEGAQVTGSEESGWEVTFDETNSTYEVNSDGNITNIGNDNKDDNEEIAITSEKDLATVGYFYNTMYDPSQPIALGTYYDDKNTDKMSDINPSLGLYMSSFGYDIPVEFFTDIIPTRGEIKAIITHYDGRIEEITFEEEILKIDYDTKEILKIGWIYESEEEGVWGDKIKIEFIPYAMHNTGGDRYKTSDEYHYLEFSDSNAMSFEKIEIFGKTIEYPFNCQGYVGFVDSDFEDVEPVYNDINKVNKVIVNYSNNEQKIYTKNDIFNANLYCSEDGCFYYSSADVPILYTNGAFIINMPDSSFKTQITSIIVEEDGAATKYNVNAFTEITNSPAWN